MKLFYQGQIPDMMGFPAVKYGISTFFLLCWGYSFQMLSKWFIHTQFVHK